MCCGLPIFQILDTIHRMKQSPKTILFFLALFVVIVALPAYLANKNRNSSNFEVSFIPQGYEEVKQENDMRFSQSKGISINKLYKNGNSEIQITMVKGESDFKIACEQADLKTVGEIEMCSIFYEIDSQSSRSHYLMKDGYMFNIREKGERYLSGDELKQLVLSLKIVNP